MADWALCVELVESVEEVADDEELVLLTLSWASDFSMALRNFEPVLFTLPDTESSLSESLLLPEMLLYIDCKLDSALVPETLLIVDMETS
jgi:hypothetical protein